MGCSEIAVDYARALFYAGDTVIRRGDWITIDGGTGEVMEDQVPTIAPPTAPERWRCSWAGPTSAPVSKSAPTPTTDPTPPAHAHWAVGIGLCRTEHMFFQPDALRAMRQMILAKDERTRLRALNDILPIQRESFLEIFRAMDVSR